MRRKGDDRREGKRREEGRGGDQREECTKGRGAVREA